MHVCVLSDNCHVFLFPVLTDGPVVEALCESGESLGAGRKSLLSDGQMHHVPRSECVSLHLNMYPSYEFETGMLVIPILSSVQSLDTGRKPFFVVHSVEANGA